eukprot:tig00020952_g16498.t1
MNFCQYNDRYDKYEGLPDWARKSLEKHKPDHREKVYSRGDLEAGRTADPYWNASQVRAGHAKDRMGWAGPG